MKKKQFSKFLKAERDNLSLWFVVWFAGGILAYFALPFEPNIYAGLAAAFVFAIGWIAGRKDFWAYYIIGFLLCFSLGFTVAQMRTHRVAAPVLESALFDAGVTGTVAKTRLFLDSQQIVLKDVQIDGLSAEQTPKFVRMNVGGIKTVYKTGDRLSLYAHLFPPMAPVAVGAYNFAFHAYFNELGATGKATGEIDILERSDEKPFLENVRRTILLRVKSLLPASSAGVVIPLIIGEQGTVDRETYELYRKTGIAHVLSVSGLHLSLIAGFVFLCVRMLLGLFPFIALRVNAKKIAAVAAILMTLFYLLISGMEVPAIRSFAMIFVVLLGVLFNRNAISLRSVALAAGAILLIWPETILGASFQLSFAAVLTLVSLYEAIMKRFKSGEKGLISTAWLFLLGMLCVDILASLATAPYTIYHFNQYATYSVLGNLLTSSIFTFAVMPLLLVGVLLMPFGWDAIFIQGAGVCISFIADVCRWIVTLPHASLTVPAMPAWGLTIISLGILILCLMKTRARVLGLVVIAIGFASYLDIQKPAVLVSENVFAVRGDGEKLILSNADNRFITDTWLRRNGQNPDAYHEMPFDKTSVRISGHKIAFTSLDCANAEATFFMRREFGGCGGIVISRTQFRRDGTHEVYLENGRVKVISVMESIRPRPWNRYFMLARKNKISYDINENQ